ncbi:MAG TPA: hypothetical protein VIN06_18805 [Devosia sp.]
MRQHPLFAVFAALVLLTFTPAPAVSVDVLQAEMEPLDLEIENQRLILVEINRQAVEQVQFISEWAVWWTKIKTLATETGTKLKKNYDERIKGAEKAASLLGELYAETVDQQRFIPHLGWHNAATIGQLIYTLKKETAEWTKLIASGKANWFFAGAGWMTGEGIQTVIDGLEKQTRDIQQGVRDGTYQTFVTGVGWVSVADVRNRIAAAEARKAEIQRLIAAGEYTVVIPGLGPRTRNQLDAEIAAAEQDLAQRRAALAAGTVQITRPQTGWADLNALRAGLDEGQKAYDVMKTTVNDGIYTTWVVEMGWTKRIDLENKVKELEATMANVQAALAKGEYVAETPIGWVSRKGAEAAIDNLTKQLNNPALDQAGRTYLADQLKKAQKALTEIQAVSVYDLGILALEKAKYSRLITDILKLARPDFDKRDLERAQRQTIIAGYPTELALWVKLGEANLARLRNARTWLPG